MDIWQWVYEAENKLRDSGEYRLADIMDAISTWTVNDEHHKVDAVYNEALSLARLQPNKWIEVFIRHWYLQSQVLHRRNAKGMLGEAVDLLSYSSDKETKDCPQSICAVQDLANCYGVKDGPGFVSERIEVCVETFKRINPSWPCFECIAQEYIEALIDDGSYEQALDKIKSFREELSANDVTGWQIAFLFEEAFVLLRAGNFNQALTKAIKASNPYGGESFVRKKRSLIALAYAYLENFKKSSEYKLSFEEVLISQTYYLYWAELQYLCAKSDINKNTVELNAQLNQLSQGLIKNGAYRSAIQIKYWQGKLASYRNDIFILKLSAEELSKLIPKLNKPLDALDKHEDLMRIGHRLSQEGSIPEQSLHYLSEDSSANPLLFIDSLIDAGYSYLAVDTYKQHLEKQIDNESYIQRFGFLLLKEQQYQEFNNLIQHINRSEMTNNMKIIVCWLKAQRSKKENPQEAIDNLLEILKLAEGDKQSLAMLADLEMRQRNYSKAAEYYSQLIAIDEDNNSAHWDRMVAATIIGEWDLVRVSAKALNLKLSSSSGPIEEDWEYIRLQLNRGELEPIQILAERTGPVTARIVGIREIGLTQYFGNEIAFDPAPLNSLDQKDDDGDACDSEGNYNYLYREVAELSKGNYFFFDLDGVKPENSEWSELVKSLETLGLIVNVRSGENYQLIFREDGKDMTKMGIYSYIGVPPEKSLLEIHHCLTELNNCLKHPLIWPRLASEIGLDSELTKQAEIELRYNL